MSNAKFQTMEQFKESVHEHDASCSDDKINVRDLTYTADHRVNFTRRSSLGSLFGSQTMEGGEGYFNDWSWRQIAERLGMPGTSWLLNNGKCPDELRRILFNWKTENADEAEYLLRQRLEQDGRNTIRAVLSDQYTPLDHKDLIDAVSEAIDHERLPAKVFRPSVGDHLRAYIMIDGMDFDRGDHAFFPEGNEGGEDRGGSGGLHPAVYISNSEIGGGMLRITGGLFRSYCSNGIIIGWKDEESFAIRHRWKSQSHMSLLVNEALASALKMSESAAVAFLEKRSVVLKRSSLANIVDQWAGKYGLAVDTKESWLAQINQHAGMSERVTMFDLINVATFQSHNTEDEGTRENLERMAGDMIFAPVSPSYVQTEIELR